MPLARPNEYRPLPIAEPGDTALTYSLRVVGWLSQASERGELMTDRQTEWQAAVIAAQFEKVIGKSPR